MRALPGGGEGLMGRFLAWTSSLILLDQLTKWMARSFLYENETWALIPGRVEFTLVYNKGIAFGLFQGAGVYLTPLAVLVAIAAAWIYTRSRPPDKVLRVGMVLIAAGALGNFVDRIAFGGRVTDFIDLKFIHVFNIADACITIAAVLLIFHWSRDPKPVESVEDAPQAEERSETQA
jgi:signal peptidase II